MVMCFVPDCKHYNQRDDCRFFRFPMDEIAKKIWIINIRRGDRSPSKHSVVCSCHFKDQIKENGPTIFNRNENKMVMNEKLLKEADQLRQVHSCGFHFKKVKKDNGPSISKKKLNRSTVLESTKIHPKTPTLENDAGPSSSASEVQYDVYLLIGPLET